MDVHIMDHGSLILLFIGTSGTSSVFGALDGGVDSDAEDEDYHHVEDAENGQPAVVRVLLGTYIQLVNNCYISKNVTHTIS